MTERQPHILLVEDDSKLGRDIESSLIDDGFEVTWLEDGSRALIERPDDFDLVILDLMLPGAHGFDVLKRYRETSDVPIIILTARTETHDKVRGFKLGSDDYVTKPFWPEELLARVHARLRRPVLQREGVLECGPIAIDGDTREVEVDRAPIELTRVEFDILSYLAHRLEKPVTRRQLVENTLDEEREGTERTLDVHVSRIRKKLGDASDHLATVWGIGYRLTTDVEDS